jgi:hypothetical protein
MNVMDYQLAVLLAPTMALVAYLLFMQSAKGGAYGSRSRSSYGRNEVRDYPCKHYGWAGRVEGRARLSARTVARMAVAVRMLAVNQYIRRMA